MKNQLWVAVLAVGMMAFSPLRGLGTVPDLTPEQRALRRAEIARIIAEHVGDAAKKPDAGLTARVSSDGVATLDWLYDSAASSYEWQIWSDANFLGRRIARGEERASQPHALFHLPPDQPDYYWRMRPLSAPKDAAATGWKTGPALMLACVPLAIPTQTNVSGSPCSSPITAPATPSLNWSNIANESGYAWEIYPGISCTGASSNSGTTAANITTVSPSSPLGTGTYHWRVKGTGDGVNYCDSTWQCGCAFTVGTTSCIGTTAGPTTISGTITWNLAGSPYLVSGTVMISAGATLNVDPGVIIKMGPSASIDVNGTLNLNGGATNYVAVTSLNWGFILPM